MLYKFRLRHTRMESGRFSDFIEAVSNRITFGDYPALIADMVEEYDRSSIGRTTTTMKTKADAFIAWMSETDGFKVRPCPVIWRLES